MRSVLPFALILLAQPCLANSSVDGAQCEAQAGAWGRVGSVEIRDESNAYRLTVFRNGDSLSEIEEGGKVKRLLMKQAARAQLYFGVPQRELASGPNPFALFGEGFAAPVMALNLAFPDGPSSVSAEPVTKQLKMRSGRAALTAWRLADGSIGYLLALAGQRPFAGTFSARRPASISDSYMAANWGPAQLHMHDTPDAILVPAAARR
jgi:hypothetical protein